MIYFKSLKYLIKHKWLVFRYGLKYKVPLWRLIIHDWQKFTPIEFRAYAYTFYGPWNYKDRPEWLVKEFDRAWLHHIHHGPHHWQHWILHQDTEGTKVLEMPEVYVREMVADWCGANHAVNGKLDVYNWYAKTKDKQIMHPTTRHLVNVLLGWESI